MSYYVSYRVKVEGVDLYVPIADAGNITYNVNKIICTSTGLKWIDGNNGLCKDIIPCIEKGIKELQENRQKYVSLESPNGWGTIDGTIYFFKELISEWESLKTEFPQLEDRAVFWIA